MRVVVVGATGNVGTAVLAALHKRPEITSIVGIARRMPARSAEPYARAEWVSIDIAAAIDPDEAVTQLTEAFQDADAVIHLAWLIQPNSHRDLLRRVNVEGTRHVARAVANAGVRTFVVASSVGAYASSPGREARSESWPTTGIRTSHYSVDKAAQETVLNEFEAANPQVSVTRLRPALIFQGDAGSEIHRYFLGRWAPVHMLGAVPLPVLPVPQGLRMQVVHAHDVADAYAAAAVIGRPGAFNICANDVLGTKELADLVDHGRFLELPVPMVRAAVTAGHRAGLIAADPGWLDMGMNAPVMDNARAKAELDWQPRRSATDTVRELLDGMIAGDGARSVPMRARDSRRALLSIDRPATSSFSASSGEPQIATRIDRALLNLYLSDHLTGASAGAARISRMAADFVDTPVFATLSSLDEEIRAESRFLQQLIHDLGMRQLRHRQAVAVVGERIGRLKSNGRAFSRSPMTLMLEVELMRSAVVGKRGGWQTLADNAEDLGLDPEVFHDLAAKALRQHEQLDHVHAYARNRAFRVDRETFDAEPTQDGA